MSSGHSKKEEIGARFITLDAEEFQKVCQRVHELLTTRAEKAWKKHQKSPNNKTSDSHVEASKDAFAFVHLMELVEHMTIRINDMQMMISLMEQEGEEIARISQDRNKKTYLN